MKKLLCTLLAMLMLLSGVSAMAAEIGFLSPAMTSPFYASCIEGGTPVATAYGYDLLTMAPPSEDDYATQMSMMEDMITRGVAGICVCGINLDALIPAIKKANEAGIPVVMFMGLFIVSRTIVPGQILACAVWLRGIARLINL